jgi:uncharacterized protein YmfQ (DUF2313 family)
MVEKWVQRTSADYARGWNNLLPTGPAWPRDLTTELQKFITGQSGIWGNPVESNAALLLNVESDPRSTNIMLPEWERAWGLPDICIPIPPTNVVLRDTNLVAKMTFIGSQDRAFFIAQAAAFGQNVTIREYAPYMCGVSKTGDTSNYNSDLPGNITAATSAGTLTSSPTLSFASVNQNIFPGMLVYDVTNPALIGTVSSINKVANTVTLTANARSAITSGDTLYFSNRMRWALGPPENRFYWTVKIVGLLGNWAGADIACLFRRWKPAHTDIVFDFSGLQDLDESLPWDSGYVPLF